MAKSNLDEMTDLIKVVFSWIERAFDYMMKIFGATWKKLGQTKSFLDRNSHNNLSQAILIGVGIFMIITFLVIIGAFFLAKYFVKF